MLKTRILWKRTILLSFSLSLVQVEREITQRATRKQDVQDSHTRFPASGHFRAVVFFHSSFASVVPLDLSHCNARKSLSGQFVIKMVLMEVGG